MNSWGVVAEKEKRTEIIENSEYKKWITKKKTDILEWEMSQHQLGICLFHHQTKAAKTTK